MPFDYNIAPFLGVVVAVFVFAAAPASAAPFTYTNIDEHGYAFTAPVALNDQDQVVGFVEDAHENRSGMSWSNGVFAEVPQVSSFVAIDRRGLAAGQSPVNGNRDKMYVTYNVNNGRIGSNPIQGETLTYLVGGSANGEIIANTRKGLRGSGSGVLVSGTVSIKISYPGSVSTTLYGINKSGEIVGTYLPSGASSSIGFTYKAGAYASFDYPLKSGGYAPSIGPDGTIGGSYVDGSGVVVGFLLQKTTYTTVSVPNATATYVNDVGQGGEAVGQFSDSVGIHGFIYRSGTYYQIDYPGSNSTAVTHVNALGSLIGAYSLPINSAVHAFIAQCSSGKTCIK